MSKVLVVANWKMNPSSFREAKVLFDATRKTAENVRRSSVIVAPPAIFVRELRARYRGSRVAFAVQHAHFESAEAHTGEISIAQVKDARAKYLLVGHAERRAAGETDDDARKKVAAALSLKLFPILCVGERTRGDDGEHFELVREQLRRALQDVPAAKLANVIITYEPLWTVGKDTTMEPRAMHEMSIFIRKCVVETHGEAAHRLTTLYGGSVDEKNVVAMLEGGDVRGFLVGRASVNAQEFAKLLEAIEHSA